MAAKPRVAAPTGRKKIAQGQERSDDALGHKSQNMASTDGAKEGGTLPVGWERKTVGEMVEAMQYGTSAKTSEDARGVPVLRMGNIKDGSLVLDSLKYLPADHEEFPALLLQDGDLLFNRTNSAELVGKSAIYRGNPSPCACASYLIRARLQAGYVPEFLAYYLNSTFGRAWVSSVVSQQVGQANVNGTKLKALSVPVLPLAEQRRIVAEIEKQFTRLEAGVAALKRVQANLKRYRAAVLKAACEGRLVPTEAELARQHAASHPGGVPAISRGLSASDTPGNVSPQFIHPEGVADNAAVSGIPSGCGNSLTDIPGVSSSRSAGLLNPRLIAGSPPGFSDATFETGEELLARILNERRQNWQGRGQYKEPAAPDTTNLPAIPDGWTWASVEQLSTRVQYGSSAKTNEDSTGVPVLRMGNIQDGQFDFDKLKYLPKAHDEFPELLLAIGDLLFNRTNSAELVGKTAVFKGNPQPCSFASYLIRVRFGNGCIPDFVSYFINSVLGRAWIAGVVSQQVGQANVNGTKLQALAIPLPPLAEQTRIVAEVERRLSVVEELEAVVSANLQRATRLRQSILQKAFTGELV